jgi:hypothetical protein
MYILIGGLNMVKMIELVNMEVKKSLFGGLTLIIKHKHKMVDIAYISVK